MHKKGKNNKDSKFLMSGKNFFKKKTCITNVFTPLQLKAYRFLMLFLSFWSGSTRFYTGRTGYSLGIR